ncbi:WD40 repeat domain-containing protein [Vermiphilus pyriformis]|uniref:Uncharacterized protein n=1 Tax=candidate division TM6 bacterium JCVI TM6SC1 TaxID=1306947 RepID=A0A0D2JEV7_9BACT|nr:hypothetical protein J120_01290 [candidate division TM6 bacterium JCVI TM6SC1]UNE35749.1 MAG: WD40 repeat domain-containing protein [Vermiphilus pyriformis]
MIKYNFLYSVLFLIYGLSICQDKSKSLQTLEELATLSFLESAYSRLSPDESNLKEIVRRLRLLPQEQYESIINLSKADIRWNEVKTIKTIDFLNYLDQKNFNVSAYIKYNNITSIVFDESKNYLILSTPQGCAYKIYIDTERITMYDATSYILEYTDQGAIIALDKRICWVSGCASRNMRESPLFFTRFTILDVDSDEERYQNPLVKDVAFIKNTHYNVDIAAYLPASGQIVYPICFSSGNDNSKLCLSNLNSNTHEIIELLLPSIETSTIGITASPDKKLLAVAHNLLSKEGNEIDIIETQIEEDTKRLPDQVRLKWALPSNAEDRVVYMVFGSQSKWIAAYCQYKDCLRIWKGNLTIPQNEPFSEHYDFGKITGLQAHPCLALLFIINNKGDLNIYDVDQGKVIVSYKVCDHPLELCTLSFDGQKIAIKCACYKLHILTAPGRLEKYAGHLQEVEEYLDQLTTNNVPLQKTAKLTVLNVLSIIGLMILNHLKK